MFRYLFFSFLSILLLSQCKQNNTDQQPSNMEQSENELTIPKRSYGVLPGGKTVDQFTLSNKNGMSIDVITYGGIITRWTAPNKEGQYENVVLAYDSLSSYLENSPYFGAIIGRYGNRIANGKFSIDGEEYTLAQNDGDNHLHGGENGFDKVVWKARMLENNAIELSHLSADMDEGYPGTLKATVIYRLTDDDALEISYEATTDKKTVVNLTQHSYFNLSGVFSSDILDHEVMIDADRYLPVDKGLIPTGEFRSVEGTPFDFRSPKLVGKEIGEDDEQLKLGNGYDHCWVLNDPGSMRKIASVHHTESGRFLEVYTDEPAVQFYTGNFLGSEPTLKGDYQVKMRSALCLETQHYPDSPNQSEFPSTILEPGDRYQSKTTYKFSVK